MKIGDKVLCKLPRYGYYLGIIDKITKLYIYIIFLDGDKYKYKINTKLVLGLAKGTKTTEIKVEDVNNYLIPKSKITDKVIKLKTSISKQGEVVFNKTKDLSDHDKLNFIKKSWGVANIKYFDSKLSQPNFRWLKTLGVTKARRHAHWSTIRREFAFTKRIFNASAQQFWDLLLHEMCHQADREIDHNYDRKLAGHGLGWIKWMKSIGYLNPKRYVDSETHLSLFDDEEKEKRKQIFDEEAKRAKLYHDMISSETEAINPVTGDFVKFVSSKHRWEYGRLVTKMAGGKFFVCTKVIGIKAYNYSVRRLFNLNETEKHLINEIEEDVPMESIIKLQLNYEINLSDKRYRRKF